MNKKLVVVYTMNGCPYCDMMKKQLKESKIEFVERDIDIEQDEYELFVKAVGGNNYVPAFMIIETDGNNHKSELYAPGRDFEEVPDGVKIIKESFSIKK
jgi:glutaredoxin